MEDFTQFQTEVRYIITKYKYTIDDIDYINLSDKYTTSAETFFELQEVPKCLENDFRLINWCGAWSIPEGFKIVMNDGSFFMYISTKDEYYSQWIYTERLKSSPIVFRLSNPDSTEKNLMYIE